MLNITFNLSLAFMILVSSIASPAGYAQGVSGLPAVGAKLNLSKTYHPIVMLGMTLHPENPFQFDFIIDTGNENPSAEHLQSESQKLVDYFMTTLTVPENETWVNLSPYVWNLTGPQFPMRIHRLNLNPIISQKAVSISMPGIWT